MLKTLFAAGAILAVATSVAKVGFDASGVNIGGKSVTEASLQLREADGGRVLASKDVVESLGGVVEVTLDGGRIVSIEPGIRIKRTDDGYELSTHGRRPMVLMSDKGTTTVGSPAVVVVSENGWMVNKGIALEGGSLRAALSQQVDATRVAAAGDPPATDGSTSSEDKPKNKLDIRRVTYFDPFPSAESVDGQTIVHVRDVSPSGF